MIFKKLPEELQDKICDFLKGKCNICNKIYFEYNLKKCSVCHKIVCKNHFVEQINSVICEKCFYVKYESYVDEIYDLFTNVVDLNCNIM